VAAAELARLAGSCTLYTAVGNDALGAGISNAFEALSVRVEAQVRDEPHRRAVTLIDPTRERTIVVIGPAQAPSGRDMRQLAPIEGVDALYLCKGDAEAVRAARSARVVVATARMLPVLIEAGIALDALVLSSRDPSEAYERGQLSPAPALVAATDGENGGNWWTADGRSGSWSAAVLPGEERDSYGAGDSFAAGLTYALAAGMPVERAVDFAAERGAAAVCRRGAHGGLSSASGS